MGSRSDDSSHIRAYSLGAIYIDLSPTDIEEGVPALDRRTALKKLAAGGAIAAGGSLVLSSNAAAQTRSGCPALPVGVPFDVVVRSGGRITITDTFATATGSIGSYVWDVRSYRVGANRFFWLRRFPGTADVIKTTTPNSCSGGCGTTGPSFATGLGSVRVGRTRRNNANQFVNLGRTNPFSLRVNVNWTVPDGCGVIEAAYEFSGTRDGGVVGTVFSTPQYR